MPAPLFSTTRRTPSFEELLLAAQEANEPRERRRDPRVRPGGAVRALGIPALDDEPEDELMRPRRESGFSALDGPMLAAMTPAPRRDSIMRPIDPRQELERAALEGQVEEGLRPMPPSMPGMRLAPSVGARDLGPMRTEGYSFSNADLGLDASGLGAGRTYSIEEGDQALLDRRAADDLIERQRKYDRTRSRILRESRGLSPSAQLSILGERPGSAGDSRFDLERFRQRSMDDRLRQEIEDRQRRGEASDATKKALAESKMQLEQKKIELQQDALDRKVEDMTARERDRYVTGLGDLLAGYLKQEQAYRELGEDAMAERAMKEIDAIRKQMRDAMASPGAPRAERPSAPAAAAPGKMDAEIDALTDMLIEEGLDDAEIKAEIKRRFPGAK